MDSLIPALPRALVSVPARLMLAVIRVYQYLLSPYFGTQCRFTPTCSHYAAEAITLHGAARGGYLATRRICRCHPWHEGGYDPVPKIFE